MLGVIDLKRLSLLILVVALCLTVCSCGNSQPNTQIVATTLPVYEFTAFLCAETHLTVSRLITEEMSCLHDYTLQTQQMRVLENANVVVLSGSGLEAFIDDSILTSKSVIDASSNITPICQELDHEHKDSHHHDEDPHIWLSPVYAITMAETIAGELKALYPEYEKTFDTNLLALTQKLNELNSYALDQLQALDCRQLITFHDGFSYMADAFNLTILHAIEEESGSEASAEELIHLIQLVQENDLEVIFTEKNGSNSAAQIVAAETDTQIYQLDMAIAGDSYFDAMYHNINTLKEALE